MVLVFFFAFRRSRVCVYPAAHSILRLESRAHPPILMDRRVEITGPVDRKMVINALNSGANVFMADFEDSNSPTWTTISGRPDQSARCHSRRYQFHQSGRQEV
jgi:hypothetical protein